jgi:Fe2+ or Zn2+ uptake regulation protein
LRILAQASGHLDAYEILDRAREQDQQLSLATVYRTVAVLKDAGVVRELHLDREHHHYELDEKDEHSHLVCLACGRVIEVESADFVDAASAVAEAHGFQLSSAQVELTGICADCRQTTIGESH